MKHGVVEVVFNTVKGDETKKYATLMEEILPPRPVVEAADENDTLKKARVVSDKKMNFWSVNDSGWRSFILENLKTTRVLSVEELSQLISEQAVNVKAI